jgi:hypothetical protein
MMINHIMPFIGTVGYIYYPNQYRINKKLLYYISIFHNLLLIVFSGLTFYSLINILLEYGFVFKTGYYFSNKNFDRIIYYFYLSKYYEYIDTFLLYLNDKNPIFLQKYHHIGAVICWHLCYYYKVDGIAGPTLFNSFVHTIMYSYYLFSLLKIQFAKKIKKYITTLQIGQLLSINLVLYLWRPPRETVFNYIILLIFYLYVCGLVYFFYKFYKKTYN